MSNRTTHPGEALGGTHPDADPAPDRPVPPPDVPGLSPVQFARWAWRQLTSMRIALILLFLLALAAVPGSVIPQDDVDSVRASQWRDQHPSLTPVYEKLGLFSVYSSVWFSAIYILLMVSLVGCFIPRLQVYWRGLRARPPAAPRNLARLPQHRTFVVDDSEAEVASRAQSWLRSRRYRTDTGRGAVAAERGYLREAGNLLFHVSVLVVLVGFAVGGLFGYKGGVIVVVKDGFANTLSQYDDFRAGSLFDPKGLEPFDLTVDDFRVNFIRQGREAGMAHEFAADLTYRPSPTTGERQTEIRVNHPLTIGDTDVFLLSHGYAPHLTVRNADGSVAFSGAVVFLPEDTTFRSYGVVKVPDARQRNGGHHKNGHEQLGFEGEFYPTYAFTNATGPFSAFPDARNPALSMLVYKGDLGLDNGQPQSVYTLRKRGLDPVHKPDGKPLRVDLAQGRTAVLPNGLGSITFDGVSRYVKLQVSHTPGQKIALCGVVLALLGLLGSLFIRPRRIWVRVRRDGGRTLVEVAGLDRSSGGNLSGEVGALATHLGAPGPAEGQTATEEHT